MSTNRRGSQELHEESRVQRLTRLRAGEWGQCGQKEGSHRSERTCCTKRGRKGSWPDAITIHLFLQRIGLVDLSEQRRWIMVSMSGFTAVGAEVRLSKPSLSSFLSRSAQRCRLIRALSLRPFHLLSASPVDALLVTLRRAMGEASEQSLLAKRPSFCVGPSVSSCLPFLDTLLS